MKYIYTVNKIKNRYQTALNIVTSYYQKYEEKLDNIDNINEAPISKLFLLKVKYIYLSAYTHI